MKPIHLSFFAIGIAVAAAAQATPAPSTFTFTQSNQTVNSQGTSGGTAAYNGGYAGYNAATGTNYGDWRNFVSNTGTSVQVTAWGSTGALLHGGTSGYDRAIQSAFASQYSSNGSGLNELAVTSRPDTNGTKAANNELLNCGVGSTACSTNDTAPNYEHGMDNVGGYESLMFAFGSNVTLSNVAIGFPSGSTPDSDATVLAYTGSGTPSLGGAGTSARTFADLVAPGGGWVVAGNLADLATTAGNLSSTIASKYWMVGAYMAIGGNTSSALTLGNDSIKLSSITVRAVPEPGSLALFGIAMVALCAGRRRSRHQD